MGNHYKVIDAQTYQDQTVYNVLWFENTSGAGSAAELGGTYAAAVITPLLDAQNQNLEHDQVAVICAEVPGDYANIPLGGTSWNGTATGEVYPAFVAWGFRITRNERGHHHGAIRFSGLDESLVADAAPVTAAQTALDAVAAALSADLVGGSGAHYSLRIHRAANSIKPAYDNAETWYTPSGVVFVRITSQNSRKFGQ